MTAVVIVNWNGRHFLDACLEAVFAQTAPPELVVLVDNGSTDGSVEHLRARWPAVRVIALDRNAGVAAGNNVGIRAALGAGAELVLLLNSDAGMRPAVLGELRSALNAAGEGAWAAAPKIVYQSDPDRIWSAGGAFDWWRGLSRDRGTGEPDRGQYDQPGDIDYSNTCCLLVRADAFARVGLMDEAYFMYCDDSDFSARIRRAGGRIRYAPSAEVLHDVQASSGGTAARPSLLALYYTTRNRGRFIARNAPTAMHRLSAHTFTIISRFVRAAQAYLGGRGGEARLVLGALHDAYVRRETGVTRRRLTPTPRRDERA
ncbi:MAG: glycosyltransferase family 2 protein [Gemmatimonadales bacterium]